MSDTTIEVQMIFGGHLVDKDVLKKYPIVINAGVHEGQEMDDLINMVPDVFIYAIEPSRQCYQRTFENFSSCKNINFIQKALVGSDRIGTVEFTDFLSNGKYYDYGGLQDFSEFRSNGQSYFVETINIEELLKSIDSEVGFFKADIEGSEYEIIMDFNEYIASKIKQIAMEIHEIPGKSYSESERDIVDKLEGLGYTVYTHINGDINKNKQTEILNDISFTTGEIYAINNNWGDKND